MDRDNKEYLECEKRWVFGVLIFVAGFYGAFTYSIRGGVFCNAQTANFVLFAMALGNKNFSKAFYYLIPMGAYILGAVFSEALPNPIKRMRVVRWDTLLIALEMTAVIFLGFLPESAPFQISQIIINFICSMQYNTFRQAQGIPSATTFCTNHVRQIGVFIVKAFKNKNDTAYAKMLSHHTIMILCFIGGGFISTVLCNVFAGRAIWFALIPLAVLFLDFLYADLKKERSHLSDKPRGH